MAEPEGRSFTVEEANARIAELRETLARIRDARATVLRSAVVVRQRASRDGGGLDGTAYLEAMRVLRQEIEGLAAEGIVLRDADTGLVDFPSRREGRVVYLCWRPEEDRIGYWHDLNTGFAGRKPLEG
jgi:hypothetical protein